MFQLNSSRQVGNIKIQFYRQKLGTVSNYSTCFCPGDIWNHTEVHLPEYLQQLQQKCLKHDAIIKHLVKSPQ